MSKDTCEVCGHEGQRGDIEEHHIIPNQIREQVGKPRSRMARLCHTCHDELHVWCSNAVADVTYDTGTKRFRARSPQEMVKEYEVAYHRFVRYKKEQRERAEA